MFGKLAVVVFAAVTPIAVAEIPTPDPDSPTVQVQQGEGLWQVAARVCPDSPVGATFTALQQMNPWYTVGLQPGTVLWRPECSSSTTTSTTSSTTATTLPETTVAETTTSTTTSSSTSTSTSSSTTAPSTTSTVPSGACSGAAGTPGSSDGQGGCFPGPGTVGVPAGVTLTNYMGSCNITVADTVIDSKTIGCSDLQIRATGVVISRSHFLGGGVNYGGITVASGSLRIEDSWLENGGCRDCSVDGTNFTILRTEISGSNRGAWCENTCLIQDSWIHTSQTLPTGAHASGVRLQQNSTLIHNTILCDYRGPYGGDTGCSADLSGYPDFVPIHHNTIDGNLLMANPAGQGFCAYGGASAGKPYSNDPLNATFVVYRNNVFERGTGVGAQGGLKVCGTWGAITDFASGRTGNVWSNNRWSDGGVVGPA